MAPFIIIVHLTLTSHMYGYIFRGQSFFLKKNIHYAHTIVAKPKSYYFLDSGEYRRLEIFDGILVARVCPAAHWKPGLPKYEWEKRDIEYLGDSGKPGIWKGLDKIPDSWIVNISSIEFTLTAGSY